MGESPNIISVTMAGRWFPTSLSFRHATDWWHTMKNLTAFLLLALLVLPLTVRSEEPRLKITDRELYKVVLYQTVGRKDYRKVSRIIQCESGFDPWAWNRKTKDIGIWQINLSSWNEKAKSMGLDLQSPVDNAKFGLWLWKHQGVGPWEASRHCWNRV